MSTSKLDNLLLEVAPAPKVGVSLYIVPVTLENALAIWERLTTKQLYETIITIPGLRAAQLPNEMTTNLNEAIKKAWITWVTNINYVFRQNAKGQTEIKIHYPLLVNKVPTTTGEYQSINKLAKKIGNSSIAWIKQHPGMSPSAYPVFSNLASKHLKTQDDVSLLSQIDLFPEITNTKSAWPKDATIMALIKMAVLEYLTIESRKIAARSSQLKKYGVIQ